MRPVLKIFLVIGCTAVVTLAASSWYFNRQIRSEVIPAFIRETNQMESFNDLGRLETFDRLEILLKKGCSKEALQLVEVHQSLLLSGIAHQMSLSEATADMVHKEKASIADRARIEAKRTNPPRSIPRC
jgi:hypothetical protein